MLIDNNHAAPATGFFQGLEERAHKLSNPWKNPSRPLLASVMRGSNPFSLSSLWLPPHLQPRNPSVGCLLHFIKTGNVRLDVDQRGLVPHIDTGDDQRVSSSFSQSNHGYPDPVRTTRMPRREDAMRVVVQKRRANQLDLAGLMKQVQQMEFY
jgi:hypothetical protein